MTEPLDIEALRARHREVVGFQQCAVCNQPWPCDAAQLAALLTVERIGAAVHATGTCWTAEGGRTKGQVEVEMAAALLAALTSGETT
jgi:hypothetical protein